MLVACAVIAFLLAGLLPTSTDGVAAQTESPPIEPVGFVASIDTMKESLDTLNNRLSAGEIANTVQLASSLNTTHIAISVPYDNPDYARLWVDAIRAIGRRVWFRMSWNNWLGIYGQPGTMNPSTFIAQTRSYIGTNTALFRPGDIFDITPEPDQGKYWANTYGSSWNWQPRPPNAATREYNAFIRDGTRAARETFEQAGVTGVTTSIRSMNPYQILNVTEEETVRFLGRLTVDGYPDGGIVDPAQAAQKRVGELQEIYNRWRVPIVLGEMGYDVENAQVSDSQQQRVLKAEFDAIQSLPFVEGLNYWVGPGYPSPDNYNGTRIFAGTRGAWTPRPAAADLKAYFGNNIYRPILSNTRPVSPSVTNGSRIDFTTQAATGASLSGSTVKFSVLSPAGATIYTDMQTPVSFTGGATRTLIGSWPVPKGQSGGTYTVRVEVAVPGQPVSSASATFIVN